MGPSRGRTGVGSESLDQPGPRDDEEEQLQCGLGPCHPRALQPCRRLIFFSVALAIFGFCTTLQATVFASQNTLSRDTIKQASSLATLMFLFVLLPISHSSVGLSGCKVTSIERQFHINSMQVGALASANEIGFLLLILVVSHFAREAHKPRILALAAMVFGVCAVIIGLLNFVNPPSLKDDIRVNGSLQTSSGTEDQYLCKPDVGAANSSLSQCSGPGEGMSGVGTKMGQVVAMGVLIAVQGVSKATNSPLGVTYIDNNVPYRARTGFHIGLVLTVMLFGPSVGFALGGAISQYPVDFSDTPLLPHDPRWIGAWWLGFLVCGVLTFLAGLPLLLFPRRMPGARAMEDELQEDERQSDAAKKQNEESKIGLSEKTAINDKIVDTYSVAKTTDSEINVKDTDFDCKRSELRRIQVKVKELPRSLLRLLRNPVYVFLVLALTVHSFAILGFNTFLIKFVERQFGLSPAISAYVFGLANLGSGGLGTMIGGVLVSRGNLTRRGCLRWTLLAGTVAVVLSAVSLTLGCDPDNGAILGLQHRSMRVDDGLSTCTCDWGQFLPVCDGNRTYLSPCHAGCKRAANATDFKDCSMTASGHVTAGQCSPGCDLLIPFIVVLVVTTGFTATMITPAYVTILRTVSEPDKTLCVGLLSFVLSIGAYIPATVVYGAIIDTTCLIWSSTCSAGMGPCSFYDVRRLRHSYIGLETGLRALAVALFSVALGLLTWQVRVGRAKDDPLDNGSDGKARKGSLSQQHVELGSQKP